MTSATVPSRLLVLAAVGMTESEARRGGIDVLVVSTFVGPEVADLLHAATIAVVGAVPMPVLLEAVAPFPTRSEIWLKLLERYEFDRGAGALAPAA